MNRKVLKFSFIILFLLFPLNFLRAQIIFEDGFETGNFQNWTATSTYGGVGTATISIDNTIRYQGNYSAKAQVTDGTQGGYALVSKQIPWPSTNKLWYTCYVRVSSTSTTYAALGGIYLMEAYREVGTYYQKADLEIAYTGTGCQMGEGQEVTDETFLLRMAYTGRNGSRDGHRQHVNCQAPQREVWHKLTMLIDLSGTNPLYAWWLNDQFIWADYDTSTGSYDDPPTHFYAGLTNVDWGAGNKGLVWIDNCSVATTGPSVGQSSQHASTSLDVDGDNNLEFAIDEDDNENNGYEKFEDPDGLSSVLISIDGDADGKIDHFIDTNNNNQPEKYWDPDDDILTNVTLTNVDQDQTLEYVFDSNGDDTNDKYYDPDTQTINNYSPPPTPVCGNGTCETGENCQNCPADCGVCPPSGGGGGGSYTPPKKFFILINNNDSVTNSRYVKLSFIVENFNASEMIISNFADFKGAIKEPYKVSKDWDLCQGLKVCQEGNYTVFVQFFDIAQESSPIVSDNIFYKPPKTPATSSITTSTATSCFPYLTKYIKYQAINDPEEVKKLQLFLNEFEGEKLNITGIYDRETLEAVKRFQRKYAPEILWPWKITIPTGNVFQTTLKKINEIYCRQKGSNFSTTSCPYFTKYLKLGARDEEVKKIKEFLKERGLFLGVVDDIFDLFLFEAVKKFQNLYANEILYPLRLKYPTGNWYALTIKKANQLKGCFGY